MELKRGNLAIQNHVKDGRQLHLFESIGNGNYRYIGEFEYLEHNIVIGDDSDQNKRNVIVFKLLKKQE